MLNTSDPAPSQPAPPAQNADAASNNGPENVGESAYAQRFFKKYSETHPPITPPAQAAPEPTQTEPTAPAVTEPATEATAKEPEATAPATPEHTDEAEDALSQSTTLPPEVQETINKRIAKITAKRKEAERKAEAAESARIQLLEQLAKVSHGQQSQPEAQAPQVELTPQPLSRINTIQELQKLHSDATSAIQFAEYNLDREDVVERQTEQGEVVKGVVVGDQFYTKAQLRTIKYNALRTKETEIPQRAQFLQAQHQAVQEAFEAYPFLKDQTSAEYQLADQYARQMPWLRNVPDGIKIIGKMILGHKAEQEQLAKSKAQPAKPSVPKARPSGDQTAVSSTDLGATRAPVGTMARNAMAREEESLTKKGGVTAAEFAASLTRKRQLRNSL